MTATDILLWRNLRTGMTTEQAIEAHPEISFNNQPERLHDGASSDLVIGDVEVSGIVFDANLFFLKGHLSQVTLTHSGQPTLENFNTVVSLLRAKYGRELSLQLPNDDALLPMAEAEWMLDSGTNVSLIYFDEMTLNVNYQARLISEATKL